MDGFKQKKQNRINILYSVCLFVDSGYGPSAEVDDFSSKNEQILDFTDKQKCKGTKSTNRLRFQKIQVLVD
ncbi:MAG TPA: hypothetical protein DDX29_00225 [Clostridiales bacterium]|nr:hypothetical protein [Clostridiales bacterium]